MPDSHTRPRRAPPVAGVSRGKFFGGGESDSEREREREDGGVKGRDDPALRTVRRKGSFKKGVQGTMRLRAWPSLLQQASKQLTKCLNSLPLARTEGGQSLAGGDARSERPGVAAR